MRIVRNVSVLMAFLLLAGCQSTSRLDLPIRVAWFEGRVVEYITTDTSDPGMAAMMGVNFAPRLSQAVPRYPKPPGQKTILERVYMFPNGEQDRVVFASIPDPVGPSSQDAIYSPIWLAYNVTWQAGQSARSLRSEEAVLAAEEAGEVTVERTNAVLNCPVVNVI